MRTIARVSLFALLLCSIVFAPLTSAYAVQRSAAPADVIRDPASLSLLMDEANLLSSSDAAALRSKLVELSDKHKADIVIVTVKSIGNASPMEFADDYFDYNGYGRGPKKDGILLLLCMEGRTGERDAWISTKGSAIDAFTDAGIAFIGQKLVANGLSSGDYLKAFTSFADWCDKFYEKAATGKPFDVGHLPKSAGDVTGWSIAGLIGGLLIAAIVTNGQKRQLVSVKKKEQASDYILPGSLLVNNAFDVFLDKKVVSSPIPVASSSSSSGGGGGSGGSSTHTSSSGSTHGGGGFKF